MRRIPTSIAAVSIRRLILLLLTTPILIYSLGTATRPARAAAILVNDAGDTVADDGDCTLREAITSANSNTASGATIGECAAGTATDTITFAANYTITLNGSPLPAITTQVTITGNGAANTIIQADPAPNAANYRVFEIATGATVVLNNMTIRHGRCVGACATQGSRGGGILNDGGTLTVSASAVSSNSAANDGGGIYVSNGTLNVVNGSLIGGAGAGNTAVFGGGISISGPNSIVTIDNSTVSANTASAGGGVDFLSGTLNVVNGSLIGGAGAGNSAISGDGGGLNIGGGVASVDNSTVSANTAAGGGGGLYISNGGVATVDNSTVSANTAFLGGGIQVLSGTLNVVNGSLIGGPTAADGNQATNVSGGGILNADTTIITDSTIQNNVAFTNGGGVFNNGTLTVSGGIFSDNQAVNGGGIHNIILITSITNSTFSNNSATTSGGGIYNDAIINAITDSDISSNTAESGAGILNKSNIGTISGSTISGNTATNGNGGGISSDDPINSSIGTIIDSTISGNTASLDGGGIYNEGPIGDITDSTFSNNSADLGIGGGLYNATSTISLITGSTFSGNSATLFGGGIFTSSDITTITDSTFSSNSATTSGGGIHNGISTIGAITDSTFSGNTTNGDGGGILNAGTITSISGNTFSGNQAGNGGGIFNWGGTIGAVTSSTFSGNDAAIGGGINNSSSGTITAVTNSTFSGNTAGSGGGIANVAGTIGDITNLTVVGNSEGIVNFPLQATVGAMTNTLVAGNLQDCVDMPLGTGNLDSDGTCTLSLGTPLVPGVDYDTTLANNGGPTMTHALLPGSAAINATGVCPAAVGGVDQRGAARDANCDTGAYEFGPVIPLAATAVCNGANLAVTITAGDANFDISGDDPSPVTQTQTNVIAGTYTLVSSAGYGTWTNISVTELNGDTETLTLTDVTCVAPPTGGGGGGGGVSATGDVMIDVMVDPHEAEIGDSVLWTIKVWNPSSSPSGAVVVTGTFPGALRPLTETLSTTRGVASFNGQTLTVEGIGSLAPGEEVRITVSTEVVNASANLTTRNQTAPVMLCLTGRALGASDTECLNLPGELPGTGGPSPLWAEIYMLLPIVALAGLLGIGALMVIRNRRSA